MTQQMDMHQHGTAHGHGNDPSSDRPMKHRCIVFGHETVFMSHLPMFSMSEHAYQVILEVELTLGGNHKQFVYQMDRDAHPEVAFYTFDPRPFVLPDILPLADKPPRAKTFEGDLYRHHVEKQDPPPVQIAAGETAVIQTVIIGRRFETDETEAPTLQYILFGRGEELYLAHRLTRPPDFDHVIQVNVTPALPADDLKRGVLVTVHGRRNTADERIALTGQASVIAVAETGSKSIDITIDPVAEVYFNDDADMQ